MGPLIVPASGAVYLDANCVIYSVEKIEPYYRLLEPIWLAARGGAIEITSSDLVLLETLVKPLRLGDSDSVNLFRDLLLASNEVRLLPISRAVVEAAAELRAETRLGTPDAIHAATALDAGCVLFLTNDPSFRKVNGLPVAVLADLTAP